MLWLAAWASGRKEISIAPPGGQHIITLIGFSGYFAHEVWLPRDKNANNKKISLKILIYILFFMFLPTFVSLPIEQADINRHPLITMAVLDHVIFRVIDQR